MRRFFIPLPMALTAALFLSCLAGCVATGTSDTSMAWRVQSLESGFLEFQENHRRLASKVEDRDEAVETRLAALEEAVTRLSENQGGWTPPQTESKAVVEPMVTEPEDAGSAVAGGAESSETKPWAEVPGEPQVSGGTQASSDSVLASQAGPQRLYKRALDLTLADKPGQARPMFQEFLDKYPNHELVPNALYWLGETYYAEKSYPQAILAFKDVSTKYPDHDKTAAALLKIGMSYRNVGDVDNALFYLRTLVDEHPGTEPARLARQVLRELAP